MRQDFTGLWVPLVTPFTGTTRELDIEAALRLAEHLHRAGAKGLVLCGSTGEGAALTKPEQLQLLDAVQGAFPTLPIVVGVSGAQLDAVGELLITLRSRAVTGVLLPPPYYVRPPQDGILQWYRQLAAVSPAPIVIYDVPYRTGCTINRETLLTLAAEPNIAAIKDCGGDLGKTLAVLSDGRLQVLGGEDLQLFSIVAAGAVGAICASAHLYTEAFAAVIALLRDGELAAARARFAPLVPWIEAAYAAPNPIAIKYGLALHGWIAPTVRAPLTACPDDVRARVAACSTTA